MAKETKHYDFSKRIFKTAWADTFAFFKRLKFAAISALFSFLVGAGIFYAFFGFDAVMEEAVIAGAFVFAPIGLFAFLLFLWNLSIAPFKLVYEAATARPPKATGQPVQFDFEEPDYGVWDMTDNFTLAEASKLLAGQKTTVPAITDETKAWFNAVLAAGHSKEIHLNGSANDPEKCYVTREDLIKFAKARKKKPPFLFPEERENPNAWMAK